MLSRVFPLSYQISWTTPELIISTSVSRFFSKPTHYGKNSVITYDWGGKKGWGFDLSAKFLLPNNN